jgi:hypothetical protein
VPEGQQEQALLTPSLAAHNPEAFMKDAPTTSLDRTYRALSYSFGVRSDVSVVSSRLERLLQPFEAQLGDTDVATYAISSSVNGGGEEVLSVHRNGRRLVHGCAEGTVLDWILWDVNRRALARVEGFLVLHAGAVARDGRALIISAAPDSGKTTLTAGLVAAGFSYLSDEAVLLDPRTGFVHPFPRALWMDERSVRLIPGLIDRIPSVFRDDPRPAHPIPHVDIRDGAVGEACPIGWVISPEYRPGADVELASMTRAEAVAALARNSFNFPRFGGTGLRVLEEATRAAGFHRLRMGDLADAVQTVEAMMQEVSHPGAS